MSDSKAVVVEHPTAAAQRRADEALGRALRELAAEVKRMDGQMSVSYWHNPFNDEPQFRVSTFAFDNGPIDPSVVETMTSPTEALDRVRDRLNRGEWDQ